VTSYAQNYSNYLGGSFDKRAALECASFLDRLFRLIDLPFPAAGPRVEPA
jgi:hypothetical protein